MTGADENKAYDRQTYMNYLFDYEELDFLKNEVSIDQADGMVHFTTRRPFAADDPIHKVISLDSSLPISIASGATAETEWSEKV